MLLQEYLAYIKQFNQIILEQISAAKLTYSSLQ